MFLSIELCVQWSKWSLFNVVYLLIGCVFREKFEGFININNFMSK